MKSSKNRMGRTMAVLLALIMAFPASEAGVAIAQQNSQSAAAAPSGPTVAENALPESPTPQNAEQPAQGGQASTPQSGGSQSQDNNRKAVGTAAAPYEPTVGVAGSRPAGAAIAPAKQRRVRTIIISLGVIAGAGIAVGSVAALSHGSPSRP
jgi:hypothetical protein